MAKTENEISSGQALVLPWAASPSHPEVAMFGKAAVLHACGCILDKQAIDHLSRIVQGHISPATVVEFMHRGGQSARQAISNLDIYKSGLFLNPKVKGDLHYAWFKESWFVSSNRETLQHLEIPKEEIHRLKYGQTLYLRAGEKEPKSKPKLDYKEMHSLSESELQLLGSYFAPVALRYDLHSIVGISAYGQSMATGLKLLLDAPCAEIFQGETTPSSLSLHIKNSFIRHPESQNARPRISFLRDQRVGLIDDGINTGTSLRTALSLLRDATSEAPPKEIHVLIGAREKDFLKQMDGRKRERRAKVDAIAKDFNVTSMNFLDEIWSA